MRLQVFISGAAVLALGVAATRLLDRQHEGMAFLLGALTLGGGIIICGLFALKMHWHGLVGAGVLALLGTARGLGNLPDLFRLAGGDRQRGVAPVLELGVTLICLMLVIRVLRVLRREQTRRMLDRE